MGKPLLILDLDETLIYATKSELRNKPNFTVFDYKIYKRPHFGEFLKTTYHDFKLAIWSSAGDDYVAQIVNLIKPSNLEFEFVWGRTRAVYQRSTEFDELRIYGGSDSQYHYVKPLKKVKKLGFDLNRCLIVDDSPHKSKLNYGNAIYPNSYKGENEDDELIFLANYLKTIKDCSNFREIEKRNWRYQKKQHDL